MIRNNKKKQEIIRKIRNGKNYEERMKSQTETCCQKSLPKITRDSETDRAASEFVKLRIQASGRGRLDFVANHVATYASIIKLNCLSSDWYHTCSKTTGILGTERQYGSVGTAGVRVPIAEAISTRTPG